MCVVTNEGYIEGRRGTIAISALDEPALEPSSIEAEAGETVRLAVTSGSRARHEFVVGDHEVQEMAEEQATEVMHGPVEAMASLTRLRGEVSGRHAHVRPARRAPPRLPHRGPLRPRDGGDHHSHVSLQGPRQEPAVRLLTVVYPPRV